MSLDTSVKKLEELDLQEMAERLAPEVGVSVKQAFRVLRELRATGLDCNRCNDRICIAHPNGKVDIEPCVRRAAVYLELDPEAVVAEAERIVEHPSC